MRAIFQKTILLALPAMIFMASCKKDKTPEPTTAPTTTTPSYTVPTTYNYSSADFSSSTKRIGMLNEMLTYIKTAHTTTATPVLDAQKLKDMYANVNSQFTSDVTLNTCGFQLKDQTCNTYNLQTELDASFTEVGNVTLTTPAASNGTAGKLISG